MNTTVMNKVPLDGRNNSLGDPDNIFASGKGMNDTLNETSTVMRGGVRGGLGDGDDSDTEMLNNLSNGNSSFMNNDFEMTKGDENLKKKMTQLLSNGVSPDDLDSENSVDLMIGGLGNTAIDDELFG